MFIKDFRYKKGMNINELISNFSNTGLQATEIANAVEIIKKMKKNNAKIFLSFTSNIATSGLRGLISQLIELKLIDAIVTTAGAIEEDIMKAKDKFQITNYEENDSKLHEEGKNRVGNILISNEAYCNFEDNITEILNKIYKTKQTLTPSELIHEIGNHLEDKNSIIYQANKNKVPIFCPGITDGGIGFHLYLFKEKHKDFNIDIINDFEKTLLFTSPEDKKGVIAVGGGISKHHAILSCLINGGMDYAVYITSDNPRLGSMSGATTKEGISWGKLTGRAEAVTITGDAIILFPLIIISSLEQLIEEKIIKEP